MAMEKNKVKFGLNKVHYAKITSYDEEGVPTFANRFAFPVQCRCLSMQKVKHPIFTLMMVCTM